MKEKAILLLLTRLEHESDGSSDGEDAEGDRKTSGSAAFRHGRRGSGGYAGALGGAGSGAGGGGGAVSRRGDECGADGLGGGGLLGSLGVGGIGVLSLGAQVNLLGGGGLLLVLLVRGAVTLNDLDGLPRAGVVAVDVLLDAVLGGGVATGIIDNRNGLVVSIIRTLAEVGVTTGPLDGALGGVLAASNPGTNLDLHGGLGEAASALSILVVESTDDSTVNDPVNLLGGPLDGVGVELSDGVSNGVEGTAIVGGGVTLAEVVGLDLGVVTTEPLPVDLVEVSRLEDDGSHNTNAGRGTELDVEATEEHALVGGHGGSVGLLLDAEDGTIGVIVDGGSRESVKGAALTSGEVAVCLVVAESRLSRAGWFKKSVNEKMKEMGCIKLTLLERVTVGEGLGRDKASGGKGHGGGCEGLGEHVCDVDEM